MPQKNMAVMCVTAISRRVPANASVFNDHNLLHVHGVIANSDGNPTTM